MDIKTLKEELNRLLKAETVASGSFDDYGAGYDNGYDAGRTATLEMVLEMLEEA